jgi:hypothetical protein
VESASGASKIRLNQIRFRDDGRSASVGYPRKPHSLAMVANRCNNFQRQRQSATAIFERNLGRRSLSNRAKKRF